MVAEPRDTIHSMVPQNEHETAVSAVASQAIAGVQARYALAQRYPRDWDQVRVKLLKECMRPRFAEVALYNKPIGKGVVGPSIRFAEAVMRCMGNLLPSATIVYDDDRKRVLRVSVTDLENNLTYDKDITITKTVERRKLPSGQTPIATRLNSFGDTLYILPATDDDILNKENALLSKALRTNGLRHLPGDILDEALDQIAATQENADRQDPDAARKKLVDAFAQLSIMPKDLVAYLGHALDKTTPAELRSLRGLYEALRNGETNWGEVMDAKGATPAEDGDGAKEATAKSSATKERLRQKREERKVEPPATENQPAPQDNADLVAMALEAISRADKASTLDKVWANCEPDVQAQIEEAFNKRLAELTGNKEQ